MLVFLGLVNAASPEKVLRVAHPGSLPLRGRQAETGVAVSPEDGQSKAKAAQEWLAYLWVTGALRIEGSQYCGEDPPNSGVMRVPLALSVLCPCFVRALSELSRGKGK